MNSSIEKFDPPGEKYEVTTSAPDQMLVTKILEGTRDERIPGIMHVAAITAEKDEGVDGKVRYFSHQAPIERIRISSRADVQADLMFLAYVFGIADRDIDAGLNARVIRNDDGSMRVSHYDFEGFEALWRAHSFSPQQIERGIRLYAEEHPRLAATLAVKVGRFIARWHGEKGRADFKDLVRSVPETPAVLSTNLPKEYRSLREDEKIEKLYEEIMRRADAVREATVLAQRQQ